MFVVVFEVHPKSEQMEEYLGLGKLLRPELEQIDGFIDNERFRSIQTPSRILSLSTWRDEKSLIRWRTHAVHHGIQDRGRSLVFTDYRLRVAEVIQDNRVPEGCTLKQHRFDKTEHTTMKALTICESWDNSSRTVALNCLEYENFESLYYSGKFLELLSWSSPETAGTYVCEEAARLRSVRVIRHYGMYDRSEAPQYYPEVQIQGELVLW
jgi:heme-degrading monooxygenase HmoA